ncbi:MAG: fasciclin domain-containing protein [Prevotella sp.]|jgi:uncharacterized surface protein with fasciclin (FAS1) repeats|nr:fasciclin domain-containing protein [Prevotella sp.]
MKKFLAVILLFALCAPVFVSCSSDDDDDNDQQRQKELQEEVKKQVNSVTSALESETGMTAFADALKKFDVASVNYENDNLTVFAFPDNATEEEKATITVTQDLLKRHIALGKYSLDALKKVSKITMVSGEQIAVTTDTTGTVYLNGVALATPKSVSNSLLFIIGAVIPKGDLPSESAEQVKEDLSALGLELINKMEGLAGNKGFVALTTFMDLQGTMESDNVVDPGTQGSLKEGEVPTSIKAEINKVSGVYTWNKTDEEWDFVSDTTKFEFLYPATENGTTNNAKITVEFSGLEGKEPYGEVKAYGKIYVDNKQEGIVSSFPTNLSIDKYASSAPTTIEFGEYVVSMDVKKASPNTTTISLKKGTEVLLSGSGSFVADLEAADPSTTMGQASAEVSILGKYTVKGSGDAGKLYSEVNAIEEEYDGKYDEASEKKKSEEIAAVYNKYMTAQMYDATNKEVATLSARSKSYTDTYGTYYEVAGVFNFFDNTKSDVDVYFGKGFEDVIKAWEKFVAKF